MVEVLGMSLPLLLTVAGVGLLVAEAIAPGAHFVVLGVALLVAGLLGLVVPVLATPLALAAAVLVTGGVALYAYRSLDLYGGKGMARTKDSSSLVGREGRVVERVTPTGGRVRLVDGGFDPVYSARSIDGKISVGETVIVIDPGGGSVLTVEAVGGFDDIDRELAKGRAVGREAGSASEADTETE